MYSFKKTVLFILNKARKKHLKNTQFLKKMRSVVNCFKIKKLTDLYFYIKTILKLMNCSLCKCYGCKFTIYAYINTLKNKLITYNYFVS